MRHGSRGAAAGFTLVELLVALAVFAIMTLAAYRGLTAMLDARHGVERENQKWRAVALLFARLGNDLDAALDRPVRSSADLPLPALAGQAVAAGADDAQLAFTRGGYAGMGGTLAAPQRVGYRLRADKLEILSWAVLDQGPRTRPQTGTALAGVKEFDLRYLDRGGNWQTQWPLPGRDGGLPAAVEVRLALASGERLVRVFALP